MLSPIVRSIDFNPRTLVRVRPLTPAERHLALLLGGALCAVVTVIRVPEPVELRLPISAGWSARDALAHAEAFRLTGYPTLHPGTRALEFDAWELV